MVIARVSIKVNEYNTRDINMNNFESQIIQTILSYLPKNIELIQEYPFKYSRISHVFMCDAVLVKDGRLIAGIDIARALEGNISHRKAMLNSHCKSKVSIGECRIVCLDKVSYLCTVILNYSNYGTRQETIKQQAKVRRGCNR